MVVTRQRSLQITCASTVVNTDFRQTQWFINGSSVKALNVTGIRYNSNEFSSTLKIYFAAAVAGLAEISVSCCVPGEGCSENKTFRLSGNTQNLVLLCLVFPN